MSFRESLGQSESGGSYAAKNDEGFVGKYQFGADRLADFMRANGRQFTMSEFQDSPLLQEEVQAWHERDILDYVATSGLDGYFGQTVGGVTITPGSLLGMAHIGGKSGMKQFVESGGAYNPADSNGTSLSDYGKRFQSSSTDPMRPVSRPEDPMRPVSRPEGLVPQVEDRAGQAAIAEGLAALFAQDEVRTPAAAATPGGFGSSSKMSPLSRQGLPGAGAIDAYSTPGGIDALYKR